MATIRIQAYDARPSYAGGFSVVMDLTGKPAPVPARTVDVRTTGEALAALTAFKAECAATGLPLAVCMTLTDGRAPNGFKAASRNPFYHRINV